MWRTCSGLIAVALLGCGGASPSTCPSAAACVQQAQAARDPASASVALARACEMGDERACVARYQLLEAAAAPGSPPDAQLAEAVTALASLLASRQATDELRRHCAGWAQGRRFAIPSLCRPVLTTMCRAGDGQLCAALAVDVSGADRTELLELACQSDVPAACSDLGEALARSCSERGGADCLSYAQLSEAMAARSGGVDELGRALEPVRATLESACARDRLGPPCQALARMLLRGLGGQPEPERAITLWQHDCDAGHRTSCVWAYVAARPILVMEVASHDDVSRLTAFCDEGETVGCRYLGHVLYLLERYDDAERVLDDPCARRDWPSCNFLGNVRRAQRRRQEAEQLWTQACHEGGDALACFQLRPRGIRPEDSRDRQRAEARACALVAGEHCRETAPSRACASGWVPSCVALAAELARSTGTEDAARGRTQLREYCARLRHDDHRALRDAGRSACQSLLVTQPDQAVALLRESCMGERPHDCLYLLTLATSNNRRRTLSEQEWNDLILRGCDGGDGAACFHLVDGLEANGELPQRSRDRAMRLLVSGCRARHRPSCVRAARLHYDGVVRLREAEAVRTTLSSMCEAARADGGRGLVSAGSDPVRAQSQVNALCQWVDRAAGPFGEALRVARAARRSRGSGPSGDACASCRQGAMDTCCRNRGLSDTCGGIPAVVGQCGREADRVCQATCGR